MSTISRFAATSTPAKANRTRLDLLKNNEAYIVIYNEASSGDALRMIGRWATNPELSFTWHDAAVLSQRIRKLAK